MSVHQAISPAILYWGTPVVLISTMNPPTADTSSFTSSLPVTVNTSTGTGTITPNLAPTSSAFWLGDRCVLGLASHSQTTLNLLRTGECVLNLPEYTRRNVEIVNALARTTGTEDVPATKLRLGYRHVRDKFGVSGCTAVASETVAPPRVQECAVHMEAKLVGFHEMMGDIDGPLAGFIKAIELKVTRIWVDERIKMVGKENRIDPVKWRPMFMSFQELFGLSDCSCASPQSEEEVDAGQARCGCDRSSMPDNDIVSSSPPSAQQARGPEPPANVASTAKDAEQRSGLETKIRLRSKLAEIDEELYRMK